MKTITVPTFGGGLQTLEVADNDPRVSVDGSNQPVEAPETEEVAQ